MTGKKILVFGANGKVGGFFIDKALAAGYEIKAFMRNVETTKFEGLGGIEKFQGDSTNFKAVSAAMQDVDIVVSCLGSPKHKQIMFDSYANILNAAKEQKTIPKCILISSIGCGGTSWLIKMMLTLIGGKKGFKDYEMADDLVTHQNDVPYVLVRPYALTDKPETGNYFAMQKQNATFMKPISRADVAQFMVDVLGTKQWDGPKGVQLGGSKK